MLNLIAAAALGHIPTLKKIWEGPACPFRIVRGVNGQVASIVDQGQKGAFAPDMPPLAPADIAAQLTSPLGARKTIQVGGRSVILLWDTPKTRLAVDDHARFLALQPGSIKTIKTFAKPILTPGWAYVSGNPDWGVFTVGMASELAEVANDWLVLPGLVVSKLPACEVLDWEYVKGWRELGVGVLPGTTRFTSWRPHGVRGTIVCGNPKTGKVYWKLRRCYGRAYFVDRGRYVLAEKYETTSGPWALIDAKTGRVLRQDVSELSGELGEFLRTDGDLIFNETSRDGQPYIVEYKLVH